MEVRLREANWAGSPRGGGELIGCVEMDTFRETPSGKVFLEGEPPTQRAKKPLGRDGESTCSGRDPSPLQSSSAFRQA